MTTPLSDHRRALGHRQASRLSRRFVGVGVDIAPDRLRELAAGAPATEAERIDVTFALAVGELTPSTRHWPRTLLVAGVTVLVLCGLLLLTTLLLSVAGHTPPLYG